MKTIDLRTV